MEKKKKTSLLSRLNKSFENLSYAKRASLEGCKKQDHPHKHLVLKQLQLKELKYPERRESPSIRLVNVTFKGVNPRHTKEQLNHSTIKNRGWTKLYPDQIPIMQNFYSSRNLMRSIPHQTFTRINLLPMTRSSRNPKSNLLKGYSFILQNSSVNKIMEDARRSSPDCIESRRVRLNAMETLSHSIETRRVKPSSRSTVHRESLGMKRVLFRKKRVNKDLKGIV